MNVIVANSVGILNNGLHTILFPSRCDAAVSVKTFDYYPYELAYLSTLLKREGFDTRMVDGCYHRWNADQYAAELIKLQPDILVTECAAMTYGAMTRTALEVKEKCKTHLILTGPLGTYQPELARADGWDDVISGEYEHKVLALLQGRPEPEGYIDLDWLPWPEDNDISRRWYTECNDPQPGMIQLYPTRGCPMACVFCVAPTYYGGHGKSRNSHRVRDVEDVCDEIEYLANRYPDYFSGCFFNDENHSSNIEWLASFGEALIRRGLNRYAYDAMSGHWTFTRELVELLARAGYRQFRIGIESTSPAVWKAIHKAAPVEKVERFMSWCKEFGIQVLGTFQFGAPGSTPESDQETHAKIREWAAAGLIHKVQTSQSQPQPGTPLFEMAKQAGALTTDDYERLDFYSANMDVERVR
jgi:radical SAM superfamily enzyme YgiQ (UPF0313 family)